jgi:LPPG:FO 2-phospho-L-lactate transferase
LIVAFAGGIGAARFLEGLIRTVPQEQITVIGNVGDDIEFYGLHISPDLDIVAYTLAGVVDQSKGWGFAHDTFHVQNALKRFGIQPWFNLGDRDLATHIYRTQQLQNGRTLSDATHNIAEQLGLKIKLLPATNHPLQTHVIADRREMHFQEYMVKRQTKPKVTRIIFRGSKNAKPTRNVLESITNAAGIIICPSNPVVSIGAILAVNGIKNALKETKAQIVGVSPIIGGKTVKGPADKLLKTINVQPTAVGVAEFYRGFLDTLVIDNIDEQLQTKITALGIKPVVTNTLMRTLSDKTRLASVVLKQFKR